MAPSEWLVNRCVCLKCTFTDLKEAMADGQLSTLKDVVAAGLAGTKCQMCHMYIERMIETGKTKFSSSEFVQPRKCS
jgi:bacterioferritin-associated ferredoxin